MDSTNTRKNKRSENIKLHYDLGLTIPTPTNIDNAPCQSKDVDPDTFFPDSMDLPKIELARSFCAKCEITTRENCLSFAMTNRIRYGMWGGLTETERKSLERQRYRAKVKESK